VESDAWKAEMARAILAEREGSPSDAVVGSPGSLLASRGPGGGSERSGAGGTGSGGGSHAGAHPEPDVTDAGWLPT